ncbi:MAG: glycosyltransferase family 2 protein [Terrimicrobiaceae bacterium]|nr:glycosyltransferase family 2 protein [Terrimicrobiaceae bacterium]
MSALADIALGLSRTRLGRNFLQAAIRIHDRVARLGVPSKRLRNEGFSVAIAHYNTGDRIRLALLHLLEHPAVSEICIVDDGSRPAAFAAMESVLRKVGGSRIRWKRREQNHGAMWTKMEAVAMCRSDWVLVLDSDNTATKGYLDRLAGPAHRDPSAFYCAQWAAPFFPFHGLGPEPIDFDRAVSLCRDGRLRRFYLINDGNYLVPRDAYVETVRSIGLLPSDVVDVMVVNYRWLSQGGRLEIMDGTSYIHRVDPESFYARTEDASRARLRNIFERLEASEKWDDSWQERLLAGSA